MAKDNFNSLFIQFFTTDEIATQPVPEDIRRANYFLSAAVTYDRSQGVGQADPMLKVDAKVKPNWIGNGSQSSRGYEFHLACLLPFYLPTVGDKWEYTVSHQGNSFVVCNRFVECVWDGDAATGKPHLSWFIHSTALKEIAANYKKSEQYHIQYLKSVVLAKFSCGDDEPHASFEKNAHRWMKKTLKAVNVIVEGIRCAGEDFHDFQMSLNEMPRFLVACAAVQADGTPSESVSVRHYQVCGDMRSTMLIPQKIREDSRQWSAVKQLASGSWKPSESVRALGQAKTFARFGYFDLALIMVCTAAESSLNLLFKHYFSGTGVSEHKDFKNNYRGVSTLSLMLNMFAPTFLSPAPIDEIRKHTSALNWARTLRNDIVHDGKVIEDGFEESRLRDAFSAAEFFERIVVERNLRPSETVLSCHIEAENQ